MTHPFFDAVAFPWHHPLAKEFHNNLSLAITRTNDIELRCKMCSSTIQIDRSGTPREIWQDAIERLTTARELRKLCEDLLSDKTLAAIHPSITKIVEASSQTVTGGNSERLPSGAKVHDFSASSIQNNAYRFDVAVSFAGDNKRDKVRQIAELLREALGDGKVFFDEWFEAELAGLDAVDYLQNVYLKQAQLVVTCVCDRYSKKPWTQDEWRAIQAFERGLRDVNSGNLKRLRLLPIRFDDGEVNGLFSTAIVPDVRDRTPEAVARLILERLRLSNGGTTTERQSGIAAPDADILDDASRPYEPTESREWYTDSRNRLRALTEEILEESEVTRKFVLECNGLAKSMNSKSLAQKIFGADEPMLYLRNCHNQTKLKNKLSDESRKELSACIYRLIHFVGPACYSVEDLQAMEAHVNRKQGNYAQVSSNSKCLAVTKVAGMKGVRADLNTYPDWENFSLTGLPDSREVTTIIPKPPESGRRPSSVENPIDALVEVLADAVRAVQKTTQFVQVKLKRLAEVDKIYFILLFDTLPSENYLRSLHETFPELILLVSSSSHRPTGASRVYEATLEQDIADLLAEFGPQQSGNSPA